MVVGERMGELNRVPFFSTLKISERCLLMNAAKSSSHMLIYASILSL